MTAEQEKQPVRFEVIKPGEKDPYGPDDDAPMRKIK